MHEGLEKELVVLPASDRSVMPTQRSPANRSSLGVLLGEVLSTNAQLVAAEDVEITSTSTAIVSFPSVLPTVTSNESVACSEL